jgi:putative ABC transport system permease protein
VVAVLTLALGIGAATAIFSIVDAVVLRPFPFPEPDRLVRVWETTPDGEDFSASEPNYLDFGALNHSFSEMAAYRQAPLSLTGEGDAERLEGMAVTHTLFPLLGLDPVLGRTFTVDEDRPDGNNRVAVLSHELWQRRFGGASSALGRTTTLDGDAYTVIGVMPPDLGLTGELPDADIWIPLAPRPHWDRGDHWLTMIGRLRPEVTIDQAGADLEGIAGRIGAAHPHIAGWGVRLAPFTEWIVGAEFRRTLFVLFGAVFVLLLMACANLANLLFARATTRRAEIGIRAALGAGHGRLIRQLLTESALLAMLGAGVGLLGAAWVIDALQALEPAGIPRLHEVDIDGRVLVFATGIGLLTSIVFGLGPAVHAARVDLNELLKHGGRGGIPRRQVFVRDALVISQIALAMVLLIGAGLLIRSLVQLQRVDPGFDAKNVLAVQLHLPDDDEYREPWQKVGFFNELIGRLETLPGVSSAGATMVDPFSGWNFVNNVTPEERAMETGPNGYLQAGWRTATPGFFRTMNIRLVRGRLFSEADPGDGPRLTVITRTLAARLWPGEDPIGKGLFWGGTDGTPLTVIGVVGDYRDVAIGPDAPPLIFLPYNQLPWPSMTLVVRSSGDPGAVASAVRGEIRNLNSNLPVPEIRPLEQHLDQAVAGPRFRTLLLGFFSAIALLLATAGIYAVVAFTVAQRTREIGIRIALGAQRETISGMVLRRGGLLALLGVGLGLAGAWSVTRFGESLLYDITPTDPATFVFVSVLLGGIAILASWIPARRAMRVDPVVALRTE